MLVGKVGALQLVSQFVCLCACVCVLYQNPGKQGQEIQNSTAELIKGLVQLVPLTHTSELSQEAMEVQRSFSMDLLFNSFMQMRSSPLCHGV